MTKKILICCYSENSRERLKIVLSQYDLSSKNITFFKELNDLKNNEIALAIVNIKEGFETENLILITEEDLFGKQTLKQSQDSKTLEKILREQNNLSFGDLIIHQDYGLGRLLGLETIEYENIKKDYLKIEYSDDATLFIPIEDFNLITKYSEYRDNISLDRLGNEKWSIKKHKIKEKIQLIVEELVKIASFRKLSKAPILVPNENEYREFCLRFPWNETDDQLKSIKDVENDLLKGYPADRLICGDVGFGKTEVALRASFIATNSQNNSVQVAIICPTTLLCKQHYELFKERFKYTDIKVATLSRFISSKETLKTKEDLKSGKVNIIIGTHSLLNDSVKFKNLGLLIIDEEQRFGVMQKEKLKQFSTGIHLITLSATPIPRTLQMALTGIRDLSLITTPPIDRLNINTYVMNFDNLILREAIYREINRNGKVLIVVPRISDIQEIEIKLKDILDKFEYNIGHGQMKESKLENIISDFYDGKFKILISTTIIESGLDIPDANTIIVYKANKFGLSQLHQLRGRVGRGKKQAYCYLTTNASDNITENAKKRLKSVELSQNIGSGFAIAEDDMEIRGSGNMLGKEQSGHIKEIGIELYNQMLVEVMNKIKQNTDFKNIDYDFSPQVKLNLSTAINEKYIKDISLRLTYYKKLANIKDENEEKSILLELQDRFGDVPDEVYNILKITQIKNLCKICNIVKLSYDGNSIDITFFNDKPKKPEYIFQLIREQKATLKKQNILNFKIKENLINEIKEILNNLIVNV